MSSNEDQNWPNFRLRIGENLLFEVKHQVEEVDGSRKLLRSIERSCGDQRVTTIETVDDNTWDILEENKETNMSEEKLESFRDDWNKVFQYLQEFYPSLCF